MIRFGRQICLFIVLACGLLIGFSAAGAVDTTTAVTTSPISPVTGQAVTVTWTLTAQTGAAVTFGVEDLDREITVVPPGSTIALNDSVDIDGLASPTSSTFLFTPDKAGTYTIEGAYAGCPGCSTELNASSGSTILTVNKSDTTTSVVSDLALPVTGQTITFTATVAASSPGTGTPTGSVTFYAGGTPILGGQNVALVGGQAQCTASYNVSDSTVSITAAYGGEANYNGSDNTASPFVQTIVKADTTTAVTAAPATSVTGEDVTFTATILTTAPGSGIPTGTVTITVDDNTPTQVATSGVLPLDGSGQATFTTNLMKASGGPYEVNATYSGDVDYNVSDNTASPHSQTVTKADTSITIDSDNPDPSLEDQAYDVTWTVIVVAPGSEVPAIGATLSGNVTVDDGAVTAPATPVATGTVSITSTSAGAKTLTATYAGDGDYNGSDTTASHTVNSKGTTISVSSATNPSVMEQPVVFTATLTPDSAGGADPTGTVEFWSGGTGTGTNIGTDTDGTDPAGWSVTYAFPSAGSKSITARYVPDVPSPYTGSDSSAITQTVNKLDVVLTITGDAPDPSEIQQPYSVTWTHTDSSPALVPSGNVTVTDGVNSSTPTSILSLSASLTSTTAGAKTVTASYVGDANFNPTTATATHQVDKDDVTFTITPSNTPAWDSGDPGTFAVTLAAHGPATATPTGTVSFHIKDKNNITIATSGPHVLAAGQATSDSVTLTAAQSQVTVQVSYSGDALFNADSAVHLQDVAAAADFAIVSDDPDPSAVGESATVAWTYSAPGIPNTGTIQVIEDGSPFGLTKPVTAGATSGTIDYTGTLAGTKTLTLRYHDSVDVTDEDTPVGETHIVVAYKTTTTVSLAPASVYVNQPATINGRVYVDPDPTPDSTPGLPGKALGFTSDVPPGSDGNLSASYCVLVGGADDASCSIATYTPTMAGSDSETHRIKGSFAGDSTYGASESAFIDLTVNKRPPSVTVVCFPDWVYIDQETICTVTVDDGTVAPGSTIPTGTVTFDNGAGKAGAFTSSDSGSLTHGTYDATYTPAAGDAGTSTATTTIGADYGGSPVYTTGATSADLEVRVRPTETTLMWEDSQGGNNAIFLYETGRVIVTVTDIGPADSASPPQGTLGVVTGPAMTLVSALAPISGSTDASQAIYSFRKLAMTETQAFIGVTVEYYPVSPQTHDGSDGSTDVSVQKRTTETVVVCEDVVDGNCTVTVTDTASRGTSPSPAGAAVNQADSLNFCSLPAGGGTSSTCSNTVIGDSMMQPFAVAYEPGDDIHVGSYAMDMIERPLVPEGSCGVLHIEDSIFGLNTTCTVMAALQVLLDSGATAASILVDPVWTAVFPGSTIPVGDMIAGGLTGLSLHGEIAIQVMCTDVDGDGIPGSVEAVIAGLWDHEWDSDSDGMGDLDEIDEANGDMATSYDASKHNSCACPNPTVSDSDGDDIQDGNEQGYFGTNFCNDDTDEDGLNDGQEVGTFAQYNSDSGTTITPRTDARDHADPLAADTDGDGLGDAQEFTPGRLATSTSDPDYSSFINDADSDDDGLQDGAEDTNGDGRWSGTIGGTTSHGIGETHLCMADTDGDGLSDGEEVALFGAGSVHVVTPTGSTTVPALDTDSDNDGLSDYEEVNTTNTDPLNFDTDGDGLWDVNELRATGGTWPQRSFSQVSDPLDPDTDDDDILDSAEYSGTGLGTGHGLGGSDDTECPYVNDDDSDNDGLQDGVEDANHDGTWGIAGGGITIGSFGTQASKSVAYWETDPCNPDTDGDGIRDGEEVNLIGGGPIPGRPIPVPGFNTVTPEGRSTVTPVGPDYSGGPLFTFVPQNGPSIGATVPALDVDSDNDGLSDYEEVNITGTDPLDADSDNDTLMDADEFVALGGTIGSTPRRTFDQESDPLDINTDDDHMFDPVEGECGDTVNYGTGLSALAGQLGGVRDTTCPYINDDDSDDDGVQDGAVIPISRQGPGLLYSYIFIEGFEDVATADVLPPGTVRTVVTPATGEQSVDTICNVCDPDSDSDGLADGEEVGLGTDPQDWDTDDDGRGDWHEQTGGGPIPTDPFDPDTDDDGLLDSAEVFGSNPTNPVNADTDGDGLGDGGAGTPYMISGHPTVMVNPIIKACSTPGNTPCGTSVRTGSADGIGDHPNPMGLGEDENGDGSWLVGVETDPNQYDTDGDADGDGIEKLGFSTSRQSTIPSTDMLGQAINVLYPECGCLDPLNPDTDGDGISDGIEDLNHDGNFDFNPSDFDFQDLLDGAPQPDPEETNPCDPDTDHDGLTDYDERNQSNPAVFYPFNPTNPLDHDTDNDYLFDGEEVNWVCIDPGFNLDPDLDGVDDYYVMGTLGDVLDPTNRDSDSDGFIDGLDPNPCYSWLLPIGLTLDDEWHDTDGDGFSDADEFAAGTDPFDVGDYPIPFVEDFSRNLEVEDAIWLEDYNSDGVVDSVAIDVNFDYLVDARVWLIRARDLRVGDFDGDGLEDDVEIVVVYAFANGRYIQPRVVLTIVDLDNDLVVDEVRFEE